MIRTISLLALGSLWLACSSTMPNGYPPDFSVEYNTASQLMRSETTVKVKGTTLLLHHKSAQSKEEIDSTYDLDPQEVKALYKLLEEANYHSMQSPKPDRVLDAPEEKITAVYDGKKNGVAFGSVKKIPQPIVQCRQKMFELATKYDKRMKSILGY